MGTNPQLENFLKTFRSLRLQKGLSQEELAALAGLDRSYISLIERGKKSPTVNTLLRIADALDCKLNDFFC